jgi:hypothetical protein
MKILCKFTSFLNFLFLEAAATVIKNKLPLPRRYRHRGSGSAAMDISGSASFLTISRELIDSYEGLEEFLIV